MVTEPPDTELGLLQLKTGLRWVRGAFQSGLEAAHLAIITKALTTSCVGPHAWPQSHDTEPGLLQLKTGARWVREASQSGPEAAHLGLGF